MIFVLVEIVVVVDRGDEGCVWWGVKGLSLVFVFCVRGLLGICWKLLYLLLVWYRFVIWFEIC